MAKRRRKSSTPVRRRRVTHRPAAKSRRRRRSGGGLGAGLGAQFKPIISGAAGGVGYNLATSFVQSPMAKLGVGALGAFILGYFNLPLVGVGMAGATASDFARNNFGMADDDELEENDYTDADLSDDDLMEDEQGNVFALSDDGEPVYLGNVYDLQDEFALQDAYSLSGSGEQSVMMMPTYTSY